MAKKKMLHFLIFLIFGLNTPSLIAGSCLEAGEVVTNILTPAKLEGQPIESRLRSRSITIHLWKACVSDAQDSRNELTCNGETGIKGKRAKLLDIFMGGDTVFYRVSKINRPNRV